MRQEASFKLSQATVSRNFWVCDENWDRCLTDDGEWKQDSLTEGAGDSTQAAKIPTEEEDP